MTRYKDQMYSHYIKYQLDFLHKIKYNSKPFLSLKHKDQVITCKQTLELISNILNAWFLYYQVY